MTDGPWWWESDPDRPAPGHDWRPRDPWTWVCWCGATQPVVHYYDDPDSAVDVRVGHESAGWLSANTAWPVPAGEVAAVLGTRGGPGRPRRPRPSRAKWTATPEVAAQVARIIDGLAGREP